MLTSRWTEMLLGSTVTNDENNVPPHPARDRNYHAIFCSLYCYYYYYDYYYCMKRCLFVVSKALSLKIACNPLTCAYANNVFSTFLIFFERNFTHSGDGHTQLKNLCFLSFQNSQLQRWQQHEVNGKPTIHICTHA